MADDRFPSPGVDARFPTPGTDIEFPGGGVDARHPTPGQDARFDGSGYGTPSAPVFTIEASISSVGTDIGDTATCNPGTISGNPAPTLSYQWERGVTNVGTDSPVYNFEAEGVHTCTVTATNGEIPDATSVSNSITCVDAPDLTPPVIGTPASVAGGTTTGSVLTVTDGTATGNPTPTVGGRQWYRDAAPISGETGLQYTMLESDDTKAITCRITWGNGVSPDAISTSNAITGTGTGPSYTPSLDFSDARNSQYAGII